MVTLAFYIVYNDSQRYRNNHSHNPAQTFIVPPLGGWEGTDQHGKQTKDLEPRAKHTRVNLLAADRDRISFNDNQRKLGIFSVGISESVVKM